MKRLPGDYVAGFVDGEGCFALKFRRDVRHDRKNKPVYFYWDIEFAIMLKADDKEILESIRDTIGCGKVGNVSKRGHVRYSVQGTKEIVEKVIPFFEKYPLHAKKKRDFRLWKEAALIFSRNQREGVNSSKKGFKKVPWDEEDLERLKEMHKEMGLYKGGNRKWKWL